MPKNNIHSSLKYTCLFICAITLQSLSAATFTITKVGTGFQLQKDGAPFVVKGVVNGNFPSLTGTNDAQPYLAAIVAAGGNAMRTPSQDIGLLDQAAKLGISVLMDISGNDINAAKAAVTKLKDHSAIMMWSVGNELEASSGNKAATFQTINQIAQAIKAIDNKHIVITMVAELGTDNLQLAQANCPNLDAIGINAYGSAASLPGRIAKTGWDRAWFLSEMGPLGWWEVPKTPWGLPLEPTSTEKAATYLNTYQSTIGSSPQLCLGTFIFLWGSKQEKTHTWFGVQLPGAMPLGAVDIITFAWTGKYPANRCPNIGMGKIKLNAENVSGDGSGRVFNPGTFLICDLDVIDPENDAVTVTWDIRLDVSGNPATGGGAEPPTLAIAGAVLVQGKTAKIHVPATTGNYRIFAYAIDSKGSAATANAAIQAAGQISILPKQQNRNLSKLPSLSNNNYRMEFIPGQNTVKSWKSYLANGDFFK